MGNRGPVPQPRKKITCHLQPLATRLLEEKIPKLPHDKRNRPLIGEYLSDLIERDLRESELVAKFKDAPSTRKTKPEQKLEQKDKTASPKPKKTWLEKLEEAERKARREALERGELHDEDDDESFS
jgi:hypothetical protein